MAELTDKEKAMLDARAKISAVAIKFVKNEISLGYFEKVVKTLGETAK